MFVVVDYVEGYVGGVVVVGEVVFVVDFVGLYFFVFVDWVVC